MFCISKRKTAKVFMVLNIILIPVFSLFCGAGSIHAIQNDDSFIHRINSVSFPNAAQAQKVENLAKQAALQDREVIAAREYGDTEEADMMYNKAFDYYYDQISSMRANGMDWVDIAHAVGVNPSVLGLDRFKKS